MASADVRDYDKIIIADVRVYSTEEAAKSNDELQTKLEEWQSFARSELENRVAAGNDQLVDGSDAAGEALAMDLDVEVRYGNRALRYWVGFGAGKGRVESVLTVRDAYTDEEKFRAVAESDLAVGGFGGDIEKVLKSNIAELLDQYQGATANAD